MVQKIIRRSDWGELSKTRDRKQEKEGKFRNASRINGLKKRVDNLITSSFKILRNKTRQSRKQCFVVRWISPLKINLKDLKSQWKTKHLTLKTKRSSGKSWITAKDCKLEDSKDRKVEYLPEREEFRNGHLTLKSQQK